MNLSGARAAVRLGSASAPRPGSTSCSAPPSMSGSEVVKPHRIDAVFVAPRAYFDRRGRNQFVDDVFVAEYRINRTGVGPRRRQRFRPRCRDPAGLQHQRLQGPTAHRVARASRGRRIGAVCAPRFFPRYPDEPARADSWMAGAVISPPVLRGADGKRPARGCHYRQPAVVHKRGSAGVLVQARAKQDRPSVLHRRRREFVRRPTRSSTISRSAVRCGWGRSTTISCAATTISCSAAGTCEGLVECQMCSAAASSWARGSRQDRRSTTGTTKDWKSDITGGFILETLLGPVFLGGSVGFQGGGRFYISLGPFFQ